MSPALLFPAALVALAALLLPLAIHIARRSEQVPTDFAALRWLRQKPRPRSRLRFDEWLLLLLRLLLLAMIALWLAQPVLFGAASRKAYVAVVPGADLSGVRAETAHWLAPGFPDLDAPRPVGPLPIASLIRQIDADMPAATPLTIVVPQVIEGADAQRMRLSHKVDWRIVPGAMKAVQPGPAAMPVLSIRHDLEHRGAVRYLRAAALAWQPAARVVDVDIASIDAALPAQGRTLAWLSGGTLPDALLRWVGQGGTALLASDAIIPGDGPRAILWRDTLAVPLAEATPLGRGRLIRFTRPLAPATMPALLEPDFPIALRHLLSPPAAAPSRISAADYAPLTGGRTYDQPPEDLRPWLAALIAIILLVERWIATSRRRGIAP